MAATRPWLSIIVGARGDDDPSACLDALVDQIDDHVEVLLISDRTRDDVRHPGVQTIVRPGGLVPELWTAGIKQSSGRLIGLLAASAVPEPGWVPLIREVHAEGTASIVGGAIEPGPHFTAIDWAVYFCRYAPYMRPLSSKGDLEVPGDNASYDGEVLRRYGASFEDGFWEPFVHAAMKADGHTQRFCERRGVRVASGTRARAFRRQRFAHGQSHGRERAKGVPRLRVTLGVASAPLVPLIMTARAARIVATKRRHAGRFLAVSPVVMWFYAWWAAGEMVGRLRALGGRPSA